MGQKVNPIGFRLGINRTWDSRWYAEDGYAELLHEDINIREFLRQRLATYKVPRCVLFFARDELSLTGSQKGQVGPLRDAAKKKLAQEGTEGAGYRYCAGDAEAGA